MTDCVFCKIVHKELPSYTIYEDEQFLAILDISPVVEGHTLILPKNHYRWVHEVESFGAFWEVAQKIALTQIKVLAASSVVFATAGFQVPHAHIHVLPRLAEARQSGGGPMPLKKSGEYLPGVESAKRIKVTTSQLQEVASKLRASVE